jgi:FkbM family methyltransferase
LRERYAGREGIHIVEAAVGAEAGKLTLWRTVGIERSGKTKLDALTTADRGLLEKQIKLMGIQCSLESLEVSLLLLSQILQQYQIAKPEIVVIDTEGMDRIIMDQVDLHEQGPAVIQFEASHLHSLDLAACHQRLSAKGYRFTLTERDVIAVHPAFVSAVAA